VDELVPSPKFHDHDVGELVEVSANVTVSGTEPEVGAPVKLATGGVDGVGAAETEM